MHLRDDKADELNGVMEDRLGVLGVWGLGFGGLGGFWGLRFGRDWGLGSGLS